MKKRIIHILIISAFIGAVYYLAGGLNGLLHPTTVRAFGSLNVDFHVPAGTPLFSATNMAPGAVQTKSVDVTNTAPMGHVIALRGVRTGGLGVPALETVLTVTIADGANILYGAGGTKTVENFFSDSSNLNGIVLGYLPQGGNKTYTLTVTFPASAGNPYQGKSVVLDIAFGTAEAQTVVINEVYYRVDSLHGVENAKGNNNEWVELYNPTNNAVSLKGWTLTDSSGVSTKINANKTIASGGYIVLSKDASTWKYWPTAKTQSIELGSQLGDGLDNAGDRLILKNAQGALIDKMSWGSDSSGFTPAGTNPLVPNGASTARIYPGFDSDGASDWMSINPPTPAT